MVGEKLGAEDGGILFGALMYAGEQNFAGGTISRAREARAGRNRRRNRVSRFAACKTYAFSGLLHVSPRVFSGLLQTTMCFLRDGGFRFAAGRSRGVSERRGAGGLWGAQRRRRRGCGLDFFFCEVNGLARGPKSTDIRSSLEQQLQARGADVAVYRSLLDDYMRYWRMEKDFHADIKRRGMMVPTVSASGKEYERENPSIRNAALCNKQKLQILKELGLTTSACRPQGISGCDDL